MVTRRVRKKNKLRGNRSHGKGDTKNKRGAGCRGGRGRAGSHKHKYNKYYDSFGKEPALKPKNTEKTINVEDISSIIEKLEKSKEIEKQGKMYVFDGIKTDIDKILGKGKITMPVKLVNIKASKSAVEKILEAGGDAGEEEEEELEEFEEETSAETKEEPAIEEKEEPAKEVEKSKTSKTESKDSKDKKSKEEEKA